MSNEELVAEIQAGATEQMGTLWEQISGLVKWKANRIIHALEGRVELDDLCQSGYLAMVAAVESYKEESGAFSTWFMYHLKTAFAEATGYRTKKGQKDPINHSISLDMPLTDDADSDSLVDIIADPSGQKKLVLAEETIFREQLHDAIEKALAAIPEQYADVIRMRYYQGMTLESAAEVRGVSRERIRAMENKAIRQLRKPHIVNQLLPYYNFDFYGGTGLGAFRHSGMSIQERYLIVEEERRHKKVQALMDSIAEIVESRVANMTPEEKRALLEKYG